MKINNKKVVIVGAGAVGSTYAHNLVVDDLADEIAIINTNKSKASANSLDLLHALPYLNSAPKNIYAADYADEFSLARLTRAIFRNESVILPVSAHLTGQYGQAELYTGSPAIIDRTGVRAVLELELTAEEQGKFEHSAALLKENFESIKEKCTL